MADVPQAADRRVQRRSVLAAAGAIGLGSVATLATGVAAAGRRPAPAPSAQVTPVVPDMAAVRALLDARARAVRARDRAAFLATVRAAPPAFQATQARLFDNLLLLPVADWLEEPPSGAPLTAGPDGAVLRTRLRYRLRGFDHGPVVRARYLTVADRSGWTIVGDGTQAGFSDEPEIWDGGSLSVARGRSSLVIGNSGPMTGALNGTAGPGMPEIARLLDEAVPIVTGVVGGGWSREVVALVPADAAQAAALAGEGQNLREIAALATITPTENGAVRGEDRVIISPGTFTRLNALGRRVVLTHELTHVATGGARDARTPIWLIEGLADYVGYKTEIAEKKVSVRSAARELRREVAAGRLPGALPTREEFGGGSARLSQVYEEAWLACRMVADRDGEPALMRLYREAGRHGESAALRSVLGLAPAEFVRLWRDYLTKELR